jgi:hypothetical protein
VSGTGDALYDSASIQAIAHPSNGQTPRARLRAPTQAMLLNLPKDAATPGMLSPQSSFQEKFRKVLTIFSLRPAKCATLA